RAVGEGSVWMSVLLLSPFVILTACALTRWGSAAASPHNASIASGHFDILGGILIAMWNYMGWDNTSTIAEEVVRPQRTFPLAMLFSVLLVVVSYILPIGAVARSGISATGWSTGGWVDIGRTLGGEWLSVAIAIGGAVGAIGTFNALMLSFSRLPLVMAQDGYLPRIFARTSPKTGMPWVAITACALCWGACLFLNFEHLVIMDVLLTGLSILLEFGALIALRIREPELPRPYRVPGGIAGAVLLSLPPLVLMILAVLRNRTETIGSTSSLAVGMVLIALGPVLYFLSRPRAAKP
ncbi:MAG: APC family permease, partial [Candidatus Acidiferrales bacterium]